MSTIKIVIEAITALKDRTGSSVIAINKWIESEKKVSSTYRLQAERKSGLQKHFRRCLAIAKIVKSIP